MPILEVRCCAGHPVDSQRVHADDQDPRVGATISRKSGFTDHSRQTGGGTQGTDHTGHSQAGAGWELATGLAPGQCAEVVQEAQSVGRGGGRGRLRGLMALE